MNEEKALVKKLEEKAIVKLVDGRGALPEDVDGLWRISTIFAQTDIVPKECRNNPANIFGRAEFGMELGLSFMASLQNVSVVNGHPSLWGDAPLGIVQACGELEDFNEEEVGTWPNADYGWKCTVKRKGRNAVARISTIDDAMMAEKWCRPPRKEPATREEKFTPWYKYPKRMIQLKARSWALRDTFPDKLKGIMIGEESAQDVVEMRPNMRGGYEPETESGAESLAAKLDGETEMRPMNEQERKITNDFVSNRAIPINENQRRVFQENQNQETNRNGKWGHQMTPADRDMGTTGGDENKSTIKVETEHIDFDAQMRASDQYKEFSPISDELMKKYSNEKKLKITDGLDEFGVEYNKNDTGRNLHILLKEAHEAELEKMRADNGEDPERDWTKTAVMTSDENYTVDDKMAICQQIAELGYELPAEWHSVPIAEILGPKLHEYLIEKSKLVEKQDETPLSDEPTLVSDFKKAIGASYGHPQREAFVENLIETSQVPVTKEQILQWAISKPESFNIDFKKWLDAQNESPPPIGPEGEETKEAPKQYHTYEQLADLPQALQEIYREASDSYDYAEIEHVPHQLVDSIIKSRWFKVWKSVDIIPQTPEGFDRKHIEIMRKLEG